MPLIILSQKVFRKCRGGQVRKRRGENQRVGINEKVAKLIIEQTKAVFKDWYKLGKEFGVSNANFELVNERIG